MGAQVPASTNYNHEMFRGENLTFTVLRALSYKGVLSE
jgi:hypothetical protein